MIYLDPPFGHGTFGQALSVLSLREILGLATELVGSNGIVYLHCDPQLLLSLPELPTPRGIIVWRNGWISGFKSRSTKFWPRQYQLIAIAGFAGPKWRWRRLERPKPENYQRRGGGGGTGFVYSDWWTDIEPVDQCSFSKEKVGWPTQKPVALLERLILGSTDAGALVIDPMCGSGTTAVAARNTGRRYLVSDLDKTACELTRKRLV